MCVRGRSHPEQVAIPSQSEKGSYKKKKGKRIIKSNGKKEIIQNSQDCSLVILMQLQETADCAGSKIIP